MRPSSAASRSAGLMPTEARGNYLPEAPYELITIAIRARLEYDSTTIRLRFGYNTLQHATRFFVRSHTRSYTRISGRRVLHVD